jgi:hypothetical protein
MTDCCTPSGYGDIFDEKQARRSLRRYDRKGLDKMASSMVGFLVSRGMEGRSVLEAGGGIGAIQVELLRAGASSSSNVELSGEYESAAHELSRRENLTDLVTRRVGDFVELATDLRADDVVMHRVICCYPYPERLMSAALGASDRFVAATFPRDRLGPKIAISASNAVCRLKGADFRSFLHSPEKIMGLADAAGFEVAFEDRDFVWNAVVWERG